MQIFIVCLVLIGTNFMVTYGAPLGWDNVPIVSQGKMAFLYIMGKQDEVEKTWNNFKNKTQLWQSVKSFDDSFPGYGYIKSGIVHLIGDEDKRALEIFASSHKTTCTLGALGGFIIGSITGGPVGGSAGAVGGSLVADGTSSFLYNKPIGMIDHALHLEKKTTSQHIDAALDLTFTAIGPQLGKSTIQSSKKTISLKLEKANPRQVSITSSEVEAVFSNPSYINIKPSTGSGSYADILIKLDSEEQNRQRQMKG